MAASTARGLAEEFLYSTLSADSALAALVSTRIYASQMPEGSSYPALVFQFYQGTDAIASGFVYFLTTNFYVLRAVDRVGSIAGLDAILARVKKVINGQANIQLTNGAMLACQRERLLAMPDTPVAGVATRTLADLYRVVTQEAVS